MIRCYKLYNVPSFLARWFWVKFYTSSRANCSLLGLFFPVSILAFSFWKAARNFSWQKRKKYIYHLYKKLCFNCSTTLLSLFTLNKMTSLVYTIFLLLQKTLHIHPPLCFCIKAGNFNKNIYFQFHKAAFLASIDVLTLDCFHLWGQSPAWVSSLPPLGTGHWRAGTPRTCSVG